MGHARVLSVPRGTRIDRLARASERLLRVLADVRLGLVLLLAAASINAIAAALPSGSWLVRTSGYLVLLAAVLASGLAAIAIRLPTAWRDWRRPRPFADSRDALRTRIVVPTGLDGRAALEAARLALRQGSFRVPDGRRAENVAIGGVQRGWSQLATLGAHAAMVLLVLGGGLGLAFGHETTFSLVAGQQAFLDDGAPGVTDALRMDAFDAAFTPDGRPTRLDTRVTFMRAGQAVAATRLQVNSPGSFDGYLVHGWTYGPAIRLRVTSLAGRPLLDDALPLDTMIAGAPGAFATLEPLGATLGVSLVDPGSNTVRVSVATPAGDVDSSTLVPGTATRVGEVAVRVEQLTAYVTFLSRRDPGMGLLFTGAGLLVVCLAVGLWLPRRRVTARLIENELLILLRGGRLDDPARELERLRARIASQLGAAVL
jgi:cytochrome c biogenesis protein ResB